MDLLKRNLAPILPEAWTLIDTEAARVLRLHLAGRKIIDFQGPHGWNHAAVNTGRLTILADHPASAPDVGIGIRTVQPLIEVRVPIKLKIMELDTVARGAEDPELASVVHAAEKIALVEDNAIFNGLTARAASGGGGGGGTGSTPSGGGSSPTTHITGILEASPHAPIAIPKDVRKLPSAILAALEVLRRAGVTEPYALVLGAQLHDQVLGATEEGHSLAKLIEQQIIGKGIIRADAVRGGAVLSLRGGDYELTVGQDLSIGYAYHTKDEVELYLTESFTFRVLEPLAAVRLSEAASPA